MLLSGTDMAMALVRPRKAGSRSAGVLLWRSATDRIDAPDYRNSTACPAEHSGGDGTKGKKFCTRGAIVRVIKFRIYCLAVFAILTAGLAGRYSLSKNDVVLRSYSLAVFFCFLSMLFWGSCYSSTVKLTGETWRLELYYWDYGWGTPLMALIFALTMGKPRQEADVVFLHDLKQARWVKLGSAPGGWCGFQNAATDLCWSQHGRHGQASRRRLSNDEIGVAIVLGVLVVCLTVPKGNPAFFDSWVCRRSSRPSLSPPWPREHCRWLLAHRRGRQRDHHDAGLPGAVLFGNFYRFVAKPMPVDFENMGSGGS